MGFDELEEAVSLFGSQEGACLEEMRNDPIPDPALKALDLLLFPSDVQLVGTRRRQEIDEFHLFGFDLVAQLMEPALKGVPLGTEMFELAGCQVELKEQWPPGSRRPMDSQKRRQLVGEIRRRKGHVQSDGGNEQDLSDGFIHDFI